jgi:hypothetical protein
MRGSPLFAGGKVLLKHAQSRSLIVHDAIEAALLEDIEAPNDRIEYDANQAVRLHAVDLSGVSHVTIWQEGSIFEKVGRAPQILWLHEAFVPYRGSRILTKQTPDRMLGLKLRGSATEARVRLVELLPDHCYEEFRQRKNEEMQILRSALEEYRPQIWAHNDATDAWFVDTRAKHLEYVEWMRGHIANKREMARRVSG